MPNVTREASPHIGNYCTRVLAFVLVIVLCLEAKPCLTQGRHSKRIHHWMDIAQNPVLGHTGLSSHQTTYSSSHMAVFFFPTSVSWLFHVKCFPPPSTYIKNLFLSRFCSNTILTTAIPQHPHGTYLTMPWPPYDLLSLLLLWHLTLSGRDNIMQWLRD